MIELLVVIAIVAILSVVVILTLNPAELLRQSRDSNRVADMGTLTTALGIFSEDQSSGSLGSSSVVYLSIADPSATSTAGDQCQGLGLPALPSTYSYHCAATSTVRNVNGQGWIPVNFSSISIGAPIGSLPVDPMNVSSSRLYYTYTTNGTQYEVTSAMESVKYKLAGSSDVISTDGGTLASVYEKGSKLGLEPLDYGDSSLLGLWTMDEGTGTVAYDYSGNNATGTWNGTAAYAAGKVGSYAGNFNPVSSSTYLSAPLGNYIGQNNPLTAMAWVYANASSNGPIFGVSNSPTSGIWNMPFLSIASTTAYGWIYNLSTLAATVSNNSWHQLAITYNPSGAGQIWFYVDGQASTSTTGQYSTSGSFDYLVTYIPGAKPAPVNSYFTGLIDDVRVYNRALSASEIAAMYAGGK